MEINNFEYGATQRIEGRLKVRKFILLAIYVAFTVITFSVIFAIKMIPLGAVVPIFVWMLVFFTWRYVNIDNKYIIETGNLIFTKKYGSSKPKKIMEFRIKNAEVIAPIRDSSGAIRDFEAETVYNALPYEDCPNGYVALYKDANGKRCAFYFEATEASLKVFRYYNEKCVVKLV